MCLNPCIPVGQFCHCTFFTHGLLSCHNSAKTKNGERVEKNTRSPWLLVFLETKGILVSKGQKAE